MTTPIWRTIAAFLFLASALLPGFAVADQVTMKNGDVITGNITKIEDNKVYIDPAYADEFSVKLAEVVSIETEQVFDVELDGINKIKAQFAGAGADDSEQLLVVDGVPMNVGMMQIAEATEPEKHFDHTSHIDLNMTWNSGNTDSKNNLLFADTNIKVGDHRHKGDLTIARDETNDITTKKQDLLRYSYNWLFADPWYTGVTASWERDPIKELDHRYTVGGIIGRDIFHDSRKFLTASLGVGYSEESFSGISDSGATGLWNLVFEHDFRNGDFEFYHNQNLAYNFYADNNLIFKTNTGFRFDIYKDVYANLSLRWDYESEPAPGAKSNDTTMAVGVGAKF